MKKTLSLVMAALILLSLLTGCGKVTPDATPGNEEADPGYPDWQLPELPELEEGEVIITENPDKFIPEMVTGCGIGLGKQTSEDIFAKYGQPQKTVELSDTTYYYYSFGFFGVSKNDDLLESVCISDPSFVGPQGITVGMDIKDAAELFCIGSSEKIDRSDIVGLYEEDGKYSGVYRNDSGKDLLDNEYCQIINYSAAVGRGTVELILMFDDDDDMISFEIRLSEYMFE